MFTPSLSTCEQGKHLRAYPKTTKALISGLDILKNQSVLGRAVRASPKTQKVFPQPTFTRKNQITACNAETVWGRAVRSGSSQLFVGRNSSSATVLFFSPQMNTDFHRCLFKVHLQKRSQSLPRKFQKYMSAFCSA